MTAVIRLAEASLAALHHDQQLHQVPVRPGLRARLHEEHVGAADRLVEAHVQLAVRERLQLDLAERHAELVAMRRPGRGSSGRRTPSSGASARARGSRHRAPSGVGSSSAASRARARQVRRGRRSRAPPPRDPLGVALLDGLPRPRDGERAGGTSSVIDGSRAGVAAVADRDRRDEDGVAARVHPLADHGAVLPWPS